MLSLPLEATKHVPPRLLHLLFIVHLHLHVLLLLHDIQFIDQMISHPFRLVQSIQGPIVVANPGTVEVVVDGRLIEVEYPMHGS